MAYLVIEAVALYPSMRSRVSTNIRSGTCVNSFFPGGADSKTDAKSEQAAFAASMAPLVDY